MKPLVRTCPYCGKVLQIHCEDSDKELGTDIPPIPCPTCHAKFVKNNVVPVWGLYNELKSFSRQYFFIERDSIATPALQKMADNLGFLTMHAEPFEEHLRQRVKDEKEICALNAN